MKNPILYKALLLLALLPASPALAEEADGLPITRGEIIRSDARITFEWPSPTRFSAHVKGKTVTITFDRVADPDFGPLLSRLYPYVAHAEREADGKTIRLTLDKPYHMRTFLGDNVSGIDLLNIDLSKRRALQAKAEQKLAALAPTAGESAEKAKVSAGSADDSAIGSPSAAPPAANAPLKVSVSAAEDNAVLRFPFTERVAAAVFMRGSTLWIIFSKPSAFDLSDFDALPKTIIGKAEAMQNAGVGVLRVPVDANLHAAVAKEEGKFEWAVLLTGALRPLASALKVAVNTDAPAPANVFIPVLEMSEPVTLRDPLVGDTLEVAPLFNVGEGVASKRNFIEFSLLATAQGVAVAKKADDVQVARLRDGLRVSRPQGAILTPGLPDTGNAPAAAQSSATLFPYEDWKLDEKESRRHAVNDLFHRVVESGSPQEGNAARLRLAQLYLSEGLAPEAMAQLDGISRTNPVYYRSAKLDALRGAANFLMYRFTDAAHDFSASELNGNKEAEYWRNMLSDLLGNTDQSYDYLGLNPDYISKYPPLFRQRLAIVAADRSIDAKEYNTALKIFDGLHSDKLLDPINAYVNFLMSKISSDTGEEEDASEMWDKLADDYKHPFVQARAEFSRVVWGMNHNTLTKDEVINRLERLRLDWHGDNLEMQVLTLLGDLYAEKKDYVNAMRVWDDGVAGFPNTAVAITMSHKMEDAFVSMFHEGGADALPALEALAIYYQYRNYAPPGAAGSEMIDRLADRLISVDLLEQAASLLDYQMRFSTEKEARSRIGTRLASICLLNHQPKKALEVLQDSVYGENPVLLRLQRNRLAAQALSNLEQSDKALQMLGQDMTPEAERIRLGVYWQEKDWPKVAASGEELLKGRKDITAPLTVEESEQVIELALAYLFQGNTVQLQYLRDYFGPLMEGSPNRAMFNFVTASDIMPTPTNFDDIMQRLADTRAFVDHYQARIQLAGMETAAGGEDGK